MCEEIKTMAEHLIVKIGLQKLDSGLSSKLADYMINFLDVQQRKRACIKEGFEKGKY